MEINTHYLQNKLDPVPKDEAKELDPPVWQNGSIFTILKNLPLSSQDHGLMQLFFMQTKQTQKWSTQQCSLFIQHKNEL